MAPAEISGLRRNLLIVLLAELAFVAATRVTIHYLPWTSFEAEAIRTTLRIATAGLYWWLMKPVILSRQPDTCSLRHPILWLALALFMAIPVLVGTYGLTRQVAIMFAVTSIAVAVKEEFLFRGILQNLLGQKFGNWRAILITSVIFTLWHVGVWEPSVWTFGEIFLASIIIGLIYVRSGSMLTVIAVHAIYDAIYSFTPLLAPPLNENWGFAPMLAALALVVYWQGVRKS